MDRRRRTAVAGAPLIEEFPRTGYVRSPSDVVRLIGAVVLLAIGYAVAAIYRDGVANVQSGFLDVVSPFPAGIRDAIVGLSQVLSVVAPIAPFVVLVVRREYRLLFGMIAGGLLAIASHGGGGSLALDNAHPITWQIAERTESWLAHTSFPTAENLAALSAVVTVAGGWARADGGERCGWSCSSWPCSASARAGSWLSIFGSRSSPALRRGQRSCLRLAVLTAVHAGLTSQRRSPRPVCRSAFCKRYRAGERRASNIERQHRTRVDLHVTVHNEEDRQRDILYRLYNVLRLRGVGAERRVFTSLREDAEHDVFLSMWAARTGVRVPDVKALESSIPAASWRRAIGSTDGMARIARGVRGHR